MSEQQNLATVKKGYEAFGRGDIPGLVALFDANATWRTPGPADLPTAGARQGPQGIASFFEAIPTIVDIQRFEKMEFIAQGDRVVVFGEGSEKVKATGKTIEFRFVHSFTLRNGKVTAFEDYVDTSELVGELRKARH